MHTPILGRVQCTHLSWVACSAHTYLCSRAMHTFICKHSSFLQQWVISVVNIWEGMWYAASNIRTNSLVCLWLAAFHDQRSNCYGKRVAYSFSLPMQQVLWQACCIHHLITNAATAMASHAACSTYLGVCGLQHCHPLPFRIIHDLGKHESTTVVLLVNGSLDKYQSTQVWGLSERCSIVKAQVWSVFPYTQRWS